MSNIQIIIREEKIWFKAKDICDYLGYTNPTKTLKIVGNCHKTTLTNSEGGPDRILIDEAGLYKLILRSNKEKAEEFQEWVCCEVLPSIRKTGKYDITAHSDAFLDCKIFIKNLDKEIHAFEDYSKRLEKNGFSQEDKNLIAYHIQNLKDMVKEK